MKENNVPSPLSPQWLYSNLFTWAHDITVHSMSTQQGILPQVTHSNFAETSYICSNKQNLKVLKISASKLKWFQKYWYSKLGQF